MLVKVTRIFCILLLLVVASGVSASPIVKPCNTALSANFYTADTSTSIVYSGGDFAGLINSKLAKHTSEFLHLPIYSADLSRTTTSHVKPLPAVPAAILMVLTGFVCVSLVRDRRIWLAVLTGLLWVGQTGVHAVPLLVLHLGRQTFQSRRVAAGLRQPLLVKDRVRPRYDIEGTKYIGLLHYLEAIPSGKTMSYICSKVVYSDISARTNDKFRLPNFGIIELFPYLIPTSSSDAQVDEQPVCFSPAFIFENFPRGPPILSRKFCFKLLECIREALFRFELFQTWKFFFFQETY